MTLDPEADDNDETWMSEHIARKFFFFNLLESKQRSQRTTDAILSCPMCFTPLCYDCQRHEAYKNQYRAMFVENCDIKSQILTMRDEEGKEEYFKPVKCANCDTEVAVLDAQDIFHFFRVVAS
jgi:hypothetical protein